VGAEHVRESLARPGELRIAGHAGARVVSCWRCPQAFSDGRSAFSLDSHAGPSSARPS
jgi:hypothetical protein